MKNLIYILFLVHFSILANQNTSNNSLLLDKANKQSELLENLVQSYFELETSSLSAKENFDYNHKLFDDSIDELFLYAEKHGAKAIKLVGDQSNAWYSLNESLKLPPTKQNKLRVFLKSKTLLAMNDMIINLYGPNILKSAFSNNSLRS